jgi:polyhydroxyalkanoate synthase
MAIHARVEHWALDEVPLPARLVHQILQWLYREDRFCRGALRIGNRDIGPSSLRLPILAVANTADQVAPPPSVTHFTDAIADRDVRIIAYPGEFGVGLQHVALLVGRQAYAQVWPEVISWLRAPH